MVVVIFRHSCMHAYGFVYVYIYSCMHSCKHVCVCSNFFFRRSATKRALRTRPRAWRACDGDMLRAPLADRVEIVALSFRALS